MPTRAKRAVTDLSVPRDKMNHWAVHLLAVQRHLCRLVLALSGEDPGATAVRYKDHLVDEKEGFVELLDSQCQELRRLRAPSRIQQSRLRDLKRARQALCKLGRETPAQLWREALKSARLSLVDHNTGISTRLVRTSLYDYLVHDAEGRRWINSQIES